MGNTHQAPKQWCLLKSETVNSFENWKQNLHYTLSLDPSFAPFLVVGSHWEKKTGHRPSEVSQTMGGKDVLEVHHRTAQQKVNMLELMLGQIINYCHHPVTEYC